MNTELSIQWMEKLISLDAILQYRVCASIFELALINIFENIIVLVCDVDASPKSGILKFLEQITILYILPYIPEMNPVEQKGRSMY